MVCDLEFDSCPPWRPKDVFRTKSGENAPETPDVELSLPVTEEHIRQYAKEHRLNMCDVVAFGLTADIVDGEVVDLLPSINGGLIYPVCHGVVPAPRELWVEDFGAELRHWEWAFSWLTERLRGYLSERSSGRILALGPVVKNDDCKRIADDLAKIVDSELESAYVHDSQTANAGAFRTDLNTILNLHDDLTSEAHNLVARKGRDYNRTEQEGGDTLANLKVAAKLGLVETPAHGVLVRLMDKIMRLKSLCKPGEKPANADEKVKDTVVDVINYAIYVYALHLEAGGE